MNWFVVMLKAMDDHVFATIALGLFITAVLRIIFNHPEREDEDDDEIQ